MGVWGKGPAFEVPSPQSSSVEARSLRCKLHWGSVLQANLTSSKGKMWLGHKTAHPAGG